MAINLVFAQNKMDIIKNIDVNKLPKHLAIIMDGNGRWAKQKGLLRAFGHENGTKSVRTVVEASAKLGIENLTLFAFSTENWNRPKLEVDLLMELLINSLKNELKDWIYYGNIAALNTGQTKFLEAKMKGDKPNANDFKPKFILKVDGKAAYIFAQQVIDIFRDLNLNNLNFITSAEKAPK